MIQKENENISVESNKNSQLNSIYQWDYFSDQPYPIRDRVYKKAIRLRALPANLKLLLANFLFLPPTLVKYFLQARFKKNGCIAPVKIGLCVNLDKEPELSPSLVAELGVNYLSLRIPLSDAANIDSYVAFAKSFENVEWLFVILQDRQHIDDKLLLENSLRTIFSKLLPLGKQFQIANAINRTKWGFVSVDEYLSFFKEAQTLRNNEFSNVTLFGSSIIDFEFYALLRSLWHFCLIKYDGVAALLYVDRRGAPENSQFIFDLVGKINFFWAALSLSPKTKNRLLITEVNWPIENTKPYAPALGDVWVSESDYEKYMLRYFLLAIASGRVESIYWHQLIAPGYGLVDNREGDVRKRRAYFVFKTLCDFLNNAKIVSVSEHREYYEIAAQSLDKGIFYVAWTKFKLLQKKAPKNTLVFTAVGELQVCTDEYIELTEEPIYFYQKN